MSHTTITRRRRRAGSAALALALSITLLLAVGTTAAFASAGLRSQMLALTNQSRHAHREHSLRLDHGLSHSARRHSRLMARHGSLFHSSNVTHYLHGKHWRSWGENVGESYETNLASLQRAFMRSPDHRHNVLNRSYQRVGIGVTRRDGRVWVTLVFYG
jgi:uncharacterized protein YkwD